LLRERYSRKTGFFGNYDSLNNELAENPPSQEQG
jgi:hypothetical protein